MVNSCQKGKRGERAACAFLRSIGIEAQRAAQRSGKESADIICPDLPNVHIEVKYGYDHGQFGLGKKLLLDAWEQANEDCPTGNLPCVLWKVARARDWCLTFRADDPHQVVTACGDLDIRYALKWLQLRANALKWVHEVTGALNNS